MIYFFKQFYFHVFYIVLFLNPSYWVSAMEEDQGRILLESKEGTEIEFSHTQSCYCNTLKDLLDDLKSASNQGICEDIIIPLPSTQFRSLELIKIFIDNFIISNNESFDKTERQKLLQKLNLKRAKSLFLKKLTIEELLQLTQDANYLNFPELLDDCIETINIRKKPKLYLQKGKKTCSSEELKRGLENFHKDLRNYIN